GKRIPVQVESIKRRKVEGTSIKRKISKENDLHEIPKHKARKMGKKEHNLSKNILNNVN
ncbi:3040_t:CDS:1, partial [Gigaspora rosea]